MAKHVAGITAYTATGNTLSVASGRISYTFGLRGPAVTVDTACSSSLVSLHMAFNGLTLRQCSSAVNAGANLMLSVETPAAFAKSGMLSADGRCKTLDAAADGYVRAEALGALFLQRETLGGSGMALICSTAVNQDGRSSSLTAPNGPAQQEAVRVALSGANMVFSDLQAIQMHGTGTGLGDPIEVGALAALRAEDNMRSACLTLMAGKSLAGHSEPAAGVMGVSHAQLAVGMHASLPVLHLHGVNSYITPALQKGRWSLPRQLGGLASSALAVSSGVSSFAFQGTNAHIIVQQPQQLVDVQSKSKTKWQRSVYWAHPPVFDISLGGEQSCPLLFMITYYHCKVPNSNKSSYLDAILYLQCKLDPTWRRLRSISSEQGLRPCMKPSSMACPS
jgi:acyl transferase domain-containing protein